MKKKRKTLAEANPELAKQWHPTKNGELTPANVSSSSKDEVWWLYPYDATKTGKHFDFEWQAKISNRMRGDGCPFLSGQAVWPGFNDLATQNSELSKQWHPTKNGELEPTDVTLSSNKKVWWTYPYDDPETGKHFDFEWLATVNNRGRGRGCPFLYGKAVWPGFNDLATQNSELSKQWHPTKNGDLKPADVTAYCNDKVWWIYPYDDPETGKHFDFEWQAKVSVRMRTSGCPFLNRKAVWPGFNDLATRNPELAKQWHPTKNGDLKPTDVAAYCNNKVWWKYPYDDPETGKHFDFEWQAKVNGRMRTSGCPFLNGKAVWPGFNDLATRNSELAKQWHPTKNGDLKPTDIAAYCGDKAWWIYPYDDPETGKHFDFEWQAKVSNRMHGDGCPFLNGKAVWLGFNDLATRNSELAKQWHPTKNGDLKPTDVTAYCNDKVWWIYPYDDPETGKHFDFEWQAWIGSRNDGDGCPFISGKAVWPGFNDLATRNSELAKQWHPTKNGDLKPTDVTAYCNDKVWWKYPYDDPETGKHFDFEWQAKVSVRMRTSGCPFLNRKAVWPGFNDLAAKNSVLAKQWHPTKNGDLKPTDMAAYCDDKVWWIYPYDDPETGKHFDFEWQAKVSNRMHGDGCPFLNGKAVWLGFNDLATRNSELAKQWHPTKNGDLKPTDVTAYCTNKVWWIYPYDDPETGKHFDFEWQAKVCNRMRGDECPFLSGKAVWPGFNDLATRNPELAKQWHPTKNGDLAPTAITVYCNDKVWWIYPYDDPETGKHFDFEWQARVGARTSGNGCPFLNGQAVWPGFNDLAFCFQELANEWHTTKNRKKTPEQVYKNSSTKYWWQCGICGHKWYASVRLRVSGESECRKCAEERKRLNREK